MEKKINRLKKKVVRMLTELAAMEKILNKMSHENKIKSKSTVKKTRASKYSSYSQMKEAYLLSSNSNSKRWWIRAEAEKRFPNIFSASDFPHISRKKRTYENVLSEYNRIGDSKRRGWLKSYAKQRYPSQFKDSDFLTWKAGMWDKKTVVIPHQTKIS